MPFHAIVILIYILHHRFTNYSQPYALTA